MAVGVDYARVSELYLTAKINKNSSPIRYVAQQMGVSYSSARNWVAHTKAQGLVSETDVVVSRLSKIERAEARKRFQAGDACQWCGGLHARSCPRVKRLVLNKNGGEVEAEFWPPGTWPEENVTWPEDAVDVEENETEED